VLRLGCAVLFRALLGLDRELRGHAAGLRTHMLVALGAAVNGRTSREAQRAAADDPKKCRPYRAATRI
jgi:uncharacterized membrane protein YhiD involved in acid resistance